MDRFTMAMECTKFGTPSRPQQGTPERNREGTPARAQQMTPASNREGLANGMALVLHYVEAFSKAYQYSANEPILVGSFAAYLYLSYLCENGHTRFEEPKKKLEETMGKSDYDFLVSGTNPLENHSINGINVDLIKSRITEHRSIEVYGQTFDVATLKCLSDGYVDQVRDINDIDKVPDDSVKSMNTMLRLKIVQQLMNDAFVAESLPEVSGTKRSRRPESNTLSKKQRRQKIHKPIVERRLNFFE